MGRNNRKYCFIKFTCSWATNNPNGLEWIRTLYFSLFTGALSLFTQKIAALSNISIILFLISILLFLIGGLSSGWTATRFKKHEKMHDKQTPEDMEQKTSDDFFYERETLSKTPFQLKLIRFQHLSFYFVWIIALLSIGISFAIEQKPNTYMIEIELNNENLTQQNDSLTQITYKYKIESNNFHDSLHSISKKVELLTKQIDSLESIIRIAKESHKQPEPKKKTN